MKVFQKWCVLFLALLCLTMLPACQGGGDAPPPAEYESRLPEPGTPTSIPSAGSETEPAASPAGGSGPEQPEEPVFAPAEDAALPSEPSAPAQPLPASPPEDSRPGAEVKSAGNTKLYVLMYHSFVPEGTKCNSWTLTDTRLREDLQWLADNGYTTVLPSELAAGTPLPERAVMLTFDDGYQNNYTIAYPILQEFQAKAVISLIVNHQFHMDSGHLTWEDCREMVQSGLVEIGSHTYNCHTDSPRGIKRAEDEAREDYEARVFTDLQTSIDLIEENVGTDVLFFAYPHGQKEAWASDFLKENFSVTVTTYHGSWDISKGLYDMNRCNVAMDVPLSSLLPMK